MPQVTAEARIHGLKYLNNYRATRDITSELPVDARTIGECVTDAVEQAWKAGYDPALEPFCVIVTFR